MCPHELAKVRAPWSCLGICCSLHVITIHAACDWLVHVCLPHSVGAREGQRPGPVHCCGSRAQHTQDALRKCGVDGRMGVWANDVVIRPREACLRKETFRARYRRAGT